MPSPESSAAKFGESDAGPEEASSIRQPGSPIQPSAARGSELDEGETLHLDDCTLPGDHDGPCESDVTAGTSAATASRRCDT
jgi:hypothetical protein